MSIPLWLSAPADDNRHAPLGAPRRGRPALVRIAPGTASDPLHDPQVIERLFDGDPTAFDVLFSATYEGLLRYATRLTHSMEVAEDLVMDVFRRVWERRSVWRPDDPRVYLYGAVRNAAITARRDVTTRAALMARAGDAAAGISIAHDDPDDTVDARERLRALARAVETLPSRQREVLTLRREQQLTNAQVAEVLGIAVKTVEKDLTAAFKTLRAALAPYRETPE